MFPKLGYSSDFSPFRTLRQVLFLACVLFTGLVPAYAASVWDLRTDWSDTNNPNGAWSLNSDSNPLPHIAATSLWNANPPQGGWAACSSCRGFWFMATSAPSLNDWQVGDVLVHTQDQFGNPYDHDANVTWTSPISGVVNISGSVWMDDFFRLRGNQWNLYVKGTLVSNGLLSGADSFSRSAPFLLSTGSGGAGPLANIQVAPGDVIELQIVRTTFDGFFVGTNLTVSAVVPEPSTYLLMCLGFAFVVARTARTHRPHRGRTVA